MCLGSVQKLFKGTSPKPQYGYKLVYRTSDGYRPLYCCTWERWEIGEWYTASDKECYTYSNKTVRRLFGWLINNDYTKGRRGIKLIKTATNGWYRPGYHYFDTLKEAYDAWSEYGYNSGNDSDSVKCLLYCEFKQVHTHGQQWGCPCRVANKMMPMEELTVTEAREALEVEDL